MLTNFKTAFLEDIVEAFSHTADISFDLSEQSHVGIQQMNRGQIREATH